ncbi:MAG: hypothetical protein HY600_03190, partial [Candidatus Omnitrophica bacterium]|nr:hypothetical protein [Candidatus Omnitrophota bacterium]
MERKSFAWVWAGVGVVAVLILVTSGVWRQSTPSLNAPPNATPPIIVEPIQPTAAAQLPALSADPTADAAAGPRGQGAEESPSATWPRETPRPP